MPYVTSVERMGIQQGIQQGIQWGILQTLRESVVEILEVRFENVPNDTERIIADIDDLSILKMLLKKAATAGSMETFESILNESQDRD